MKNSGTGIERTLRVSGVLLILGLAVEIVSLLWEKPLAFLLFVGVAGSLTIAGIIVFLYSLLEHGEASHSGSNRAQ